MNYPDHAIFPRRAVTKDDKCVTLIYPGSLNWHQGLDIAVKAFCRIKDKAPDARFLIYGEGGEFDSINRLIRQLRLEDRVFLRDTIPMHEIAGVMSSSDIGVVPKRNGAFGGKAFSTKILEFMALGVSVIVSATDIDTFYFDDSVVKFFQPENVEDLATKMLEMVENKDERERIASNADGFVKDYTWENKAHIYLYLVDALTRISHGGEKQKASSCL